MPAPMRFPVVAAHLRTPARRRLGFAVLVAFVLVVASWLLTGPLPALAALDAPLASVASAASLTAAGSGDFPVQVSDDAGRRVTVAAPPRRILSLAPSNTEILFAIGAGDRVVGVDDFSDYPAAVAGLPRVGGVVNPNYEAMVALQPDLVLSIGGTAAIVQRLEELGLTVVVLQPEGLEQTYQIIELVGRLLGPEPHRAARQLIARMRAVEQEVAARLARPPAVPRPRVFYEVWYDPLMTAGPGSFVDELIRRAGGENVASGTGQPWPVFSLESLVLQDPEVVLTPFEQTVRELGQGGRPGWSALSAVKAGRVFRVDPNLIVRPGPRIVVGLWQIARRLYPDRFPEGDFPPGYLDGSGAGAGER